MATVEFMGKTFTVDEDGFIDNYENFCDEWMQWVKNQEGIEELNEDVITSYSIHYTKLYEACFFPQLRNNIYNIR